jgi:hypothetical protein
MYSKPLHDIMDEQERPNMKKNIGTTDRILRLLAAVLIGGILFAGVLKGTLGLVLGILAVVFLLTSAVGFCPLYVPLRISTKKNS